MRVTKTSAIPSIAALLAGLVAGCFMDSSADGSGSCDEVITDVYMIDAAQHAMLEQSEDQNACVTMCAELGTSVDAGCSWSTNDPSAAQLGAAGTYLVWAQLLPWHNPLYAYGNGRDHALTGAVRLRARDLGRARGPLPGPTRQGPGLARRDGRHCSR